MQLRLKTKSDVRKFAVAITVIALAGFLILDLIFLPVELRQKVTFYNIIITIILAMPISFFVGSKLMEVHLLTAQLENAVNFDTLTGLCTRASFYERLSQMENVPLVMIIADIDHFKGINDTYGHQAGDNVLKQFANTLRRYCREDDVIARFGGEEFIILLRVKTIEDGQLAAQRLCDVIRERIFLVDERQVQITASFGVSHVDSIREIEETIYRADLAAYRAKKEGRDRVCVYDPELDTAQVLSRAAG